MSRSYVPAKVVLQEARTLTSGMARALGHAEASRRAGIVERMPVERSIRSLHPQFHGSAESQPGRAELADGSGSGISAESASQVALTETVYIGCVTREVRPEFDPSRSGVRWVAYNFKRPLAPRAWSVGSAGGGAGNSRMTVNIIDHHQDIGRCSSAIAADIDKRRTCRARAGQGGDTRMAVEVIDHQQHIDWRHTTIVVHIVLVGRVLPPAGGWVIGA